MSFFFLFFSLLLMGLDASSVSLGGTPFTFQIPSSTIESNVFTFGGYLKLSVVNNYKFKLFKINKHAWIQMNGATMTDPEELSCSISNVLIANNWQLFVLKKQLAGDPIKAATYSDQCQILADTEYTNYLNNFIAIDWPGRSSVTLSMVHIFFANAYVTSLQSITFPPIELAKGSIIHYFALQTAEPALFSTTDRFSAQALWNFYDIMYSSQLTMDFNAQDFLTNIDNLKHWRLTSPFTALTAPMPLRDAGVYQYPLTFEMWVYSPGTTSDSLFSLTNSYGLATDASQNLECHGGSVSIDFSTDLVVSSYSATNVWLHLGCALSLTELVGFYNTERVAISQSTVTANAPNIEAAAAIQIAGNGVYYLDIRVWSRELSIGEFMRYAEIFIKGAEMAGLIVNYKIDEQAGNYLRDSGPNRFDLSTASINSQWSNDATKQLCPQSFYLIQGVCTAQKLYYQMSESSTPAFIQSISPPTLFTSFTFEIWMMSTADILTQHTFFHLASTSYLEITNATNTFVLTGDINGDVFSMLYNDYEPNKWAHIAFVHDQPTGMTKFYIDQNDSDLGSNLITAFFVSGIAIGSKDDATLPFVGFLYDFRVWTISRKKKEIVSLMYNSVVQEPDLAFYYPMDPISASLLFDLSLSGQSIDISGHNYNLVTQSNPPPLCEGAKFYDGISCQSYFKVPSSQPSVASSPFSLTLQAPPAPKATIAFFFYLEASRVSSTSTVSFYKGTGKFSAAYAFATQSLSIEHFSVSVSPSVFPFLSSSSILNEWHLLSIYNDDSSVSIFHNGQTISQTSAGPFTNSGETLNLLLIPSVITPFLRSFYYFPFQSPELYSLWTRRSTLIYSPTIQVQFLEDNWILKQEISGTLSPLLNYGSQQQNHLAYSIIPNQPLVQCNFNSSLVFNQNTGLCQSKRAAHFKSYSSLTISLPSSVASIANLTTPLVISIWSKSDALESTSATLLKLIEGDESFWTYSVNPTKIAQKSPTNSTTLTIADTDDCAPQCKNWMHLTYALSNSSLQAYQNGLLQGEVEEGEGNLVLNMTALIALRIQGMQGWLQSISLQKFSTNMTSELAMALFFKQLRVNLSNLQVDTFVSHWALFELTGTASSNPRKLRLFTHEVESSNPSSALEVYFTDYLPSDMYSQILDSPDTVGFVSEQLVLGPFTLPSTTQNVFYFSALMKDSSRVGFYYNDTKQVQLQISAPSSTADIYFNHYSQIEILTLDPAVFTSWIVVSLYISPEFYALAAGQNIVENVIDTISIPDYSDLLTLKLKGWVRNIRIIKPSTSALPFDYYQAYARRTLQSTSQFIQSGSMLDLEMRRFVLKNETFVFINHAARQYVNLSDSYTFSASTQTTTSKTMCADYRDSVVEGACSQVQNLVFKENSKFQIALTDPFKNTELTVGFYFCIKPTSTFSFFSLVGDNGHTIRFQTDTNGHLSLITTSTTDLAVDIALGVWTYAIFSTDLTISTGTKEIELYIGTEVHTSLSGAQYAASSFESVVMNGGFASISNLVLQNSLFSDYAEAKRMLKYRPMYTEYDRSNGKIPSIYYLDGSDLFVGATKLLDRGQLKYTSVLRLGEVQMMSYHPFIPSFAFEEGKEQSADAMSEQSTGRGFAFTNFNMQGSTITHTLSIPPFSLDFGTWAFELWIKLHTVVNPPFTIMEFDANNFLQYNFTGGYKFSQQSGTQILSFGNLAPSLKQWSHLAVSAKDGAQQSFLNAQPTGQLQNPNFSPFDTTVSKILTFTLNDQTSYSLTELRFWYIERTKEQVSKYKELELLPNTYGLLLYYPLRNFDISDRIRQYNQLTASSGSSKDYFAMEDLLIYSRANTVFEMSESETVASFPIPSGQHTMEGFTIKGWINLKFFFPAENSNIGDGSDFLKISPYVNIKLTKYYQIQVIFSMYASHVTVDDITNLVASIEQEKWVPIAIVQDEPNSSAKFYSPTLKTISFSFRNPTQPLEAQSVQFQFTHQKQEVSWRMLCRYFIVYSFAQDNPLYSIDSREQFGVLVYFDIQDVDPNKWVLLDATNSQELQCNQVTTLGNDVCVERERAFTLHQNYNFALSPQKQRGQVGQFSLYFEFKLHASANTASARFLSLEGVYEIKLNDELMELVLLTQSEQKLDQVTSSADQWLYAFISRVSGADGFTPVLGFKGEGSYRGFPSSELMTLPTYLRFKSEGLIKPLSIRHLKFWAFGLEELVFDSMFRRSFSPTLLSPYLILTYNFDDQQGKMIRFGRHLQIFNEYPGLSWSDGTQYQEYQRCSWAQTPWPQNLCGSRNKVLSSNDVFTLSLVVSPLQDLSFLIWINLQSGSSGYILGDNQFGISFTSTRSIVQIDGIQKAELVHPLEQQKWINIRLTNSKALGLLFFSAESNYTISTNHEPAAQSLSQISMGHLNVQILWHSLTVIKGPLLPIDFNANPFYKFEAFLSYAVTIIEKFDFTHSLEGNVLTQVNTVASASTLTQVMTGLDSTDTIPMLNCGFQEIYDNLARRCVTARRSLVFQTDHHADPQTLTFPVNSGSVSEFTLTVWIKLLSDTDKTEFLINLDQLAYIEILTENKIALDAYQRSRRLVEASIPDYQWHITTISSIKSVFYIACIYSFNTNLIGFEPGIQLPQNAKVENFVMNSIVMTGSTKYQQMFALRRLEIYAYYLELNTISLFAYTSTNLSGEATPLKLWFMDESKESILYNAVNLADSFVVFDSNVYTWRPRLLSDKQLKSIECIVGDGYYDYTTNQCYTDLNCVPTTYGNLCVTTIGVILICDDGYLKRGNSCELTCIDSSLKPSGNTCRKSICGEYLKEREDCPGLPLLMEAALISNSRIHIMLSEYVDSIPVPYNPAQLAVTMSGPKSVYQFSVTGIELGPVSVAGQYNDFYLEMETISTIRADEQVYFNVQVLDKDMFFPRTLDQNTPIFSLKAFTQMNPQYVEQLQFIEEVREQLAQAIGSSVTTSVGFSLFLDASMKYLWALINASQLVEFTPLIKVPLPQNFKILIKFIDFASGDVFYMQKLEEQLNSNGLFSAAQTPPLDPTFEDFQYSTTAFLPNYKMIVIIMILEATIVLAVLSIFLLLKACRCKKLSKKVGGCLGCSIIFRHFLQFSFETFIICFVGLYSVRQAQFQIQFSSWSITLSTVSLFLFGLSYVFIFVLSLVLLHRSKAKLTSSQFSENWRLSELTKELNLNSRQSCRIIFYPFFIVHRALFAAALVFLRDYTELQLDSLILLSILWMAYLLIGRPLKSVWQMTLQLIDSVTFLIIMGMFMHLHFYGYQMTDSQNFQFGYTMILIFAVSFALNFLTVIVVLVKSIVLFFIKCFCKKCKKAKRKYEINQEFEGPDHSTSTLPLEEESEAVITREAPLKAKARQIAGKGQPQPRPRLKAKKQKK